MRACFEALRRLRAKLRLSLRIASLQPIIASV